MNSKNPRQLIQQLLDNDPFSQWLGIKLMEVKKGFARVTMTVRPEMLNGFAVAHGAIPYALADTALAFAAGSRNRVGLTLTNNISFLRRIEKGDTLVATSRELNLHQKYGVYEVHVNREDEVRLAAFRGTVYRSKRTIGEQLSRTQQ